MTPVVLPNPWTALNLQTLIRGYINIPYIHAWRLILISRMIILYHKFLNYHISFNVLAWAFFIVKKSWNVPFLAHLNCQISSFQQLFMPEYYIVFLLFFYTFFYGYFKNHFRLHNGKIKCVIFTHQRFCLNADCMYN